MREDDGRGVFGFTVTKYMGLVSPFAKSYGGTSKEKDNDGQINKAPRKRGAEIQTGKDMRNNKPEQSAIPIKTSPIFIFFCCNDTDVFIPRNAVRVAIKNTINRKIGSQRANIHKETTETKPKPENASVKNTERTNVTTKILYSGFFQMFNNFIFTSFAAPKFQRGRIFFKHQKTIRIVL